MVTTTREAAPAVRLNADWQTKYRQRAQQFLLQSQHSIAQLHEAFTTKLHLHHPPGSIAGKLSQNAVEKPYLEQDAVDADLHGHSDQLQGYLRSDYKLPTVCVVGRSGVGKSSLIYNLLQERAAAVSCSHSNMEEHTFDYHGLFCMKEIPAYDSCHVAEVSSHCERLRRHLHRSSCDRNSYGREDSHSYHSIQSDSSHSSGHGHSSHSSGHGNNSSHRSHSSGHGSNSSRTSKHGSSHGKGRKLNLDEFVQMYGLFEDDTKAIIFVVNSSITTDDEKLMDLAVENRKFFCVVCTHMDNLVKIVDGTLQKRQLDELEGQLRKDLSLLQSLNVRLFIVSISSPEGQSTVGPDQKIVSENIQELQFPLLNAYLLQPTGLLYELQIHGFVKEEVQNALDPFVNVKKRHQALDFSQHLVAGTLIPIAGPVMVSFLKTMRYTLKACSEVGLIEDADEAMNKVSADANKHGLSAKIASKEGLITAVHESLIHIFGTVIFEIAIAEVVSTAAEAALHEALPLVGPVISAAHLPGRFKKIGEKLASKACMLHELWIMQNITGLLGKAGG